MSFNMPQFSHGSNGLTRFPPNVEQITVRRDSTVFWLTLRRNDTELSFPLRENDRRHLAGLLLDGLEPDRQAGERQA